MEICQLQEEVATGRKQKQISALTFFIFIVKHLNVSARGKMFQYFSFKLPKVSFISLQEGKIIPYTPTTGSSHLLLK